MNYQITEAEHRSLELLRDQLDLITGLLTVADVELGVITSTNLFAFLDARSKDLNAVLKSANERQEQQWALDNEQGSMQFFDWLHALRIVRCDALHTPNGAQARITYKLKKTAQINPDMQCVHDEWIAALGVQTPTASAPKTAPKPRKRDRLTAGAV